MEEYSDSRFVFLAFDNKADFRAAHTICYRAMTDEKYNGFASVKEKHEPEGMMASLDGVVLNVFHQFLLIPKRYLVRIITANVQHRVFQIERGAQSLSGESGDFLKGKESELGLAYRF